MHARLKLSPLAVQVGTLVILSIGCLDTSRPTDPPAAPPASPPVAPPPLSRPGVSYVRVSPSSVPGRSYYELYDDSTFSLKYLSYGSFEYTGKLSRADDMITLQFDAWYESGLAQGTLRGDSLIVKYNEFMHMTDFEDGIYVRSSGQ